MKENIEIKLPKGFMNIGITTDNFFIADTNYSKNWDTLKFPLPKGKWVLYKVIDNKVILKNIKMN